MSRTVAAIEDAFGRAIQHALDQGWPGDVASLRQAKVSIATLTAQLAAAEAKVAVAAEALEPLAKLSSDAEWDDVPDSARADVVYRSEAGGEESIGTIAFADFRRARAAIRALADQHKPSPAGEPRP